MVTSNLSDSIEVKRALIADVDAVSAVIELGEAMFHVLSEGRKILVFGNGGSAADSQHLAAELVGHYTGDRRALAAVALTVDTSIITGVGNDFGYESVFSRQVEALGRPGDLALGISTSGNSPNVVKALEQAGELGLVTAGLTGMDGGKMVGRVQHLVCVPSRNTQRIQESHVAIVHTLCDLVERHLERAEATAGEGPPEAVRSDVRVN